MSTPEVVVVGAGLAGGSVAWHLAGKARVTVLDQGAQPGTEATAQNAGMVRTLGEDPYERALAVRTHRWLADPPDGFAHASRQTGAVLGLAIDPHWLSDGVAHLKAAGIAVEPVDRPEAVAPALAGAPLLRAWHLPDAPTQAQPPAVPDRASPSLAELEIDALRRALAEADGNVSAAARQLGIARSTVYRMLKRHGLA